MVTNKTIIIVSGMVDATIKEFQPDTEFQIFRTFEELGNFLHQRRCWWYELDLLLLA